MGDAYHGLGANSAAKPPIFNLSIRVAVYLTRFLKLKILTLNKRRVRSGISGDQKKDDKRRKWVRENV